MVEEGASASQLFAAVFFMLAGARRLRLSQRTGEAPERLLGLYFALTGVLYLGWVLPFVVAGAAARAVGFRFLGRLYRRGHPLSNLHPRRVSQRRSLGDMARRRVHHCSGRRYPRARLRR